MKILWCCLGFIALLFCTLFLIPAAKAFLTIWVINGVFHTDISDGFWYLYGFWLLIDVFIGVNHDRC